MTQIMDSSFQKVLGGHFSEPPKSPAKVVRVFLSSTFTDYSVERNALIQRVYPAIKRYCRERHGADFQVVDMRWGIRQDAQDDHRESDICLKEIETAQRVSAGPNFILLLGQRYGTRSLNHLVPADEFEMFRDRWTQQQANTEHLVLMNTWFKRDDNAIPPVYVLQRISSILHNYMTNDEESSEADRAEWRRIESIIYGMLKRAAEECFRAGKLSEDRLRVYTVSVTEREIIHGILAASDVSRRVLVFDRTIDAIDPNHAKAVRFVDMIGQQVDEEATQAISRVRSQVLAAVDKKNVFDYRVQWSTKGGIDEVEHSQYVDDFCNKFRVECIRLIDDARRRDGKTEDPLITEVIEHARHCYESVRVFMGREDLISKMREFITDTSSQEPLVVHGESGSGKTSVMAKSAMECHSWLGDSEHTRVILRFLGTTPTSSSISATLRSICLQIISLYDLKHVSQLPDDIDQLQLFFSEILLKVPSEHKLCIFLDSIDQLSVANRAHELFWVPRALPGNVKIVFSVLPGSILDRFMTLFESSAFLEVNALEAGTSIDILLAWFHKTNRRLTLAQQQVLMQHLQGIECLPLNIKLIFDKIRAITSYESLTKNDLPDTVPESTEGAFRQLMLEHGEKLVSHALGYLTLSKNGLSEIELEDLLSLDDEVLGDVYQFHLPSVRRLPSILWARIRQDIEDYIVEREADGVSVIYWYHRQFIEAATRMFLNTDEMSTNKLCQVMADYFLGTWSGRAKPFEYSDYWQKKMGITEKLGEAERHVPDQQMETVVLDDVGKKIVRYNRRKISLILHLLAAWRENDKVLQIAIDDFFFNYEFLHAIFSTQRWEATDIFDSVKVLLAGLREIVKYRFAMAALFGTFLMAAANANEYPHNLAAQLCGRMLTHYGVAGPLTAFLDQCDALGPRHCALVSPHQQLPVFNGGEIFSMKKHTDPIQLVASSSSSSYVGSISKQVLLLLNTRSGKAPVYALPTCEQTFHRLYLYRGDNNLVAVISSPKAFFIFAEDKGCVVFSHEMPKEEATAICDLVVVGNFVAVSFDKRKEVEVYDFVEKELVTRLESPRDSGCVKKLVDAPLFYMGRSIIKFWLFWENGDVTCHDPADLSVPAAFEPVGVPVKCTYWAGESESVIALLVNGMLVSFGWTDGSISHRIYCLRQRLPDDCHHLICTPDGWTVLLCCRNSVHVLKNHPKNPSKNCPMIHGSCEETYDNAAVDKEGSIIHLSREGSVKSQRVAFREKRLRFDWIQTCEPHFRPITAMLHTTGDGFLLTAAKDGFIKVAQVKRKPTLNVQFERTEARITKIVSQKTVAITVDETRSAVTVWDILHGTVTVSLNIANVYDATLSEDQLTLAVSTAIGGISLFQRKDTGGSSQPQLVISNKTPSRLLYCSETRSIVARTSEHVCLITESDFRVDTIRIETNLEAPSCLENGSLVAISADQQHIVIVSLTSKSVTRQIALSSQEHFRSIYMADASSILALTVSHRLTKIGITSADVASIDENVICTSKVSTAIAWMNRNSIKICSLPSLTTLQSIELDTAKEYAHLCLTPDGHYVVYAALPFELHLRRVRDGALLGVYCMHTSVCMLATSADSQFVLTATEDRRLFVLLIADPDIPEHLQRIKALPSRTPPEMDEDEKNDRINMLGGMWSPEQENDGDSEKELVQDEADFIDKQECSQKPGWALNTEFVCGVQQMEENVSHLQAPESASNNGIENETKSASSVPRSQACILM